MGGGWGGSRGGGNAGISPLRGVRRAFGRDDTVGVVPERVEGGIPRCVVCLGAMRRRGLARARLDSLGAVFLVDAAGGAGCGADGGGGGDPAAGGYAAV